MNRLPPGVGLHLLHIPVCRSNAHARGTKLLMENTDNDRTTGGDLYGVERMLDELEPQWEVHRCPGWGWGNFFAWETTVCVQR